MNDQLKLAYLGGFVDGEGSIAVGINNGNGGRKRYYLRFSVHQLDPAPLLILESLFGGSVRNHTNRSGNSRPIWEWVVVSEKARVAIETLRPYLIVKAAQADVALEFQSLLNERQSGRTVTLTPEELSQRHALYKKLQEMKWEPTQ